jgi:hypothetical protein
MSKSDKEIYYKNRGVERNKKTFKKYCLFNRN